jgi:uncharacterized protein YbgA (DUF1722 family)/uncharacterized protein YbbK (DUF523 family)
VPLRIGVSSCLLGERVRFDGGHTRDRFVTDELGRWVQYVPVCPEMESGMGAPRPTMRLVEDSSGTRLVAPSTGRDLTAQLTDFSASRVGTLGELDGYVLKSKSPSCGMERIRVYGRDGDFRHKSGVGFFAAELKRRWPLLPLEEEGRLNDSRLRENFIERIFLSNRWRVYLLSEPSRGRLVQFHTAHKLLVRAHNEAAYRRLGRLVAAFGTRPEAEIHGEYALELQRALGTRSTPKKHANVLQHALGYLKRALDPKEKREILTAIDDFRRGLLPLVVPVTLLRFAIVTHGVDYLRSQLYFDPHPKELMLRNHV